MIFDSIDGFNKSENWGNWMEVNGMVFLLLHAIRKKLRYLDNQSWISIHCAFASKGHSEGSQHYIGNAVDFHIVSDIPYHELITQMEKILNDLQVGDRCGLGIYPMWNSPGFHLDVRGSKARWGFLNSDQVPFITAKEYALNVEVERNN